MLLLLMLTLLHSLPRPRQLRYSVPRMMSTPNSLFFELKHLRKEMAERLGLPLYRIYTNAVLEQMAIQLPTTKEEILALKGVGQKNLAFADEFIAVISPHKKLSNTSTPRTLKLPVWENVSMGFSKINTLKSLGFSNSEEIREEDLNAEQRTVARRVLEGESTFITGSAGTGKSYLLRYLIQRLIHMHGEGAVGVTASTGIAALQIGGQTLHSFSGIGLAKGSIEEIFASVTRSQKRMVTWRQLKVLIIDEISMLEGQIFEMIEEFARRIRKNDSPFGGIQLVVVGDFLQLPPVKCDRFCFESDAWAVVGLKDPEAICILNEVQRQRNPEFAHTLNEIRLGRISDSLLSSINSCCITCKPLPDDGILPTKLYCVNADVDDENRLRLAALPTEEYIIEAIDSMYSSHSMTSKERQALLDFANKTVSSSIALKVGAQVMMVRNKMLFGGSDSYGMVNGQRGVVVGFTEQQIGEDFYDIPLVKFDTGRTLRVEYSEWEILSPTGTAAMKRKQIPLKLAWAITVHKSQGCTLSRAELMVDNAFEYGQAYTALSRVTGMEGLWLTRPLSRRSIKTHAKVLSFYNLSKSILLSAENQ